MVGAMTVGSGSRLLSGQRCEIERRSMALQRTEVEGSGKHGLNRTAVPPWGPHVRHGAQAANKRPAPQLTPARR